MEEYVLKPVGIQAVRVDGNTTAANFGENRYAVEHLTMLGRPYVAVAFFDNGIGWGGQVLARHGDLVAADGSGSTILRIVPEGNEHYVPYNEVYVTPAQ
ncbi:hypothetical protein L3Q67_42105 [Saccharothrix sp. AJ9571]|nr:hypothetical protein L3Q67_42105 [Saccharothrix sp. AJ9571]